MEIFEIFFLIHRMDDKISMGRIPKLNWIVSISLVIERIEMTRLTWERGRRDLANSVSV
jgi:hypothetical protein